MMKKTVKQLVGKSQGHVLGERTFAAITAVEGISLSAAGRKRLASMKKRKLTTEQQRSEVVRAYSETKNR
ncbi:MULTISPECIES: hypothetical protein [Bradyrhizobium]|jgi:hypothetical protein|nr:MULTISPECIES: hypothetical protein [unclassified Bradyrhizobium]MDU0956272.1 hypothetical protein [Bradyrhizobium sp.]MDU1667723.1 hypothetical protein [Bradyrhizobium sp.]MDU3130681.1 hypothetical protein [Bradyrhizobium sp.]MDU6133974.1 hypothetical protein [Bradyrhizobium sp.]MDU6491219.1 hypothetical protein [Bradyrhizobium sp.]